MTAGPTERVPSVSVVLPFFNEQRFLEGAVDSVRGQRDVDWELLLVDDGSDDGSGQLADRIAAGDADRIRVLRHPGGTNRGLPESRNLGLRHARAEIVAFLDADDRWLPAKLGRQLDAFGEHRDVALAVGPVIRRPVDGGPDELREITPGAPRVFRPGQFVRDLLWGPVDPPSPSSAAYRTAALRAVGGVPVGDNLYEDQRTYAVVSMRHAVYVDSEPLAIYTVRPDSLYGSIVDHPHVTFGNQMRFQQWVVRTGLRGGRHGIAISAETAARRAKARARHSAPWQAVRRIIGRRGAE
ncbi:MAG TPA: glycosyltransferase family 2 protein [Ilumatobacter sp.]|nr:glycosyltransferase family 2 protein [Ilumatobacter sp.]